MKWITFLIMVLISSSVYADGFVITPGGGASLGPSSVGTEELVDRSVNADKLANPLGGDLNLGDDVLSFNGVYIKQKDSSAIESNGNLWLTQGSVYSYNGYYYYNSETSSWERIDLSGDEEEEGSSEIAISRIDDQTEMMFSLPPSLFFALDYPLGVVIMFRDGETQEDYINITPINIHGLSWHDLQPTKKFNRIKLNGESYITAQVPGISSDDNIYFKAGWRNSSTSEVRALICLKDVMNVVLKDSGEMVINQYTPAGKTKTYTSQVLPMDKDLFVSMEIPSEGEPIAVVWDMAGDEIELNWTYSGDADETDLRNDLPNNDLCYIGAIYDGTNHFYFFDDYIYFAYICSDGNTEVSVLEKNWLRYIFKEVE